MKKKLVIFTSTDYAYKWYIAGWIEFFSEKYSITVIADFDNGLPCSNNVDFLSFPVKRKLSIGDVSLYVELFKVLSHLNSSCEKVILVSVMPKAWLLSSILKPFFNNMYFVPFFTGLYSNSFRNNSFKYRLFSFVEAMVSRLSDCTIFDSPSQLITFKEKNPHLSYKLNSTFSLGGLDVAQFPSIKYKVLSDSPVVAHIGRLCRRKGTDHFITLCSFLDKKGSFCFYLRGPIEDDCCDLEYSKLANSLIQSSISSDFNRFSDPLHHLSEVDFLVMPSQWEGFGIMAAQAILSGVVVVGYRVDGLVDCVLDSYGGFLVEDGEIEDLGNVILNLTSDISAFNAVRFKGYKRLVGLIDRSCFNRNLDRILSSV